MGNLYRERYESFEQRLEAVVVEFGGFKRFCEAMDTTPSNVYRWLIGEVKPNFDNLVRMANQNVNLQWLLTGELEKGD